MDNITGDGNWNVSDTKVKPKKVVKAEVVVTTTSISQHESFKQTDIETVNSIITKLEKHYVDHPNKKVYDLLIGLRLSNNIIKVINNELNETTK